LALGSFFGGKLAAAPFWTFATISTHLGHGALVGLVLLFTVRSGKAPTVLTLTATLKS
jgi:hypothetical protein